MRQVIGDGALAKDPRPPLVVSMDDRAEPVVTMRLADFVELIWKQQNRHEEKLEQLARDFDAEDAQAARLPTPEEVEAVLGVQPPLTDDRVAASRARLAEAMRPKS
jgi:hypothetical protein